MTGERVHPRIDSRGNQLVAAVLSIIAIGAGGPPALSQSAVEKTTATLSFDVASIHPKLRSLGAFAYRH